MISKLANSVSFIKNLEEFLEYNNNLSPVVSQILEKHCYSPNLKPKTEKVVRRAVVRAIWHVKLNPFVRSSEVSADRKFKIYFHV